MDFAEIEKHVREVVEEKEREWAGDVRATQLRLIKDMAPVFLEILKVVVERLTPHEPGQYNSE